MQNASCCYRNLTALCFTQHKSVTYHSKWSKRALGVQVKLCIAAMLNPAINNQTEGFIPWKKWCKKMLQPKNHIYLLQLSIPFFHIKDPRFKREMQKCLLIMLSLLLNSQCNSHVPCCIHIMWPSVRPKQPLIQHSILKLRIESWWHSNNLAGCLGGGLPARRHKSRTSRQPCASSALTLPQISHLFCISNISLPMAFPLMEKHTSLSSTTEIYLHLLA